MRAVWTKVCRFMVKPVVLGAVAAIILLSLGGWFWLAGISYEYPGPAAATAMLAMAVFFIGLAISDLQAKSGANEARTPGRLPRLTGLELLVKRWQEFEPAERDRPILDEQIQIALSIALGHYYTYDEICFVEYFRGTKMKGGVFLVTTSPNMTPVVLKFDSLANITKEQRNYEHCVREFLRDTPGEAWEPHQRYGTIEHEDWGAIAYHFVGRDTHPAALRQLQTFGEYYLDHNEAQIAYVINKIFRALEPWWRMRRGWPGDCRRGGPRSLYDEYDRLTRKGETMRQGIQQAGQVIGLAALANIEPDPEYLDFGINFELRNPFNWIRDVFATCQLGAWSVQHRQDSIVHGDFHTGNILIEDQGELRVRLIDFPHVHIGPTVQDIARLEADIKFGLLPDETLEAAGPKGMYRYEMSLPPMYPAETEPLPEEPVDKHLQKAWCVVQMLRSEARQYMIGIDARPYDLALLHATLPVLAYRDRSPWQKLYAFVAAGLLCERLAG